MRIVLQPKLSGPDAERYDAFVDRAVGAHFSQTRSWARLAMAGKSLTSVYFMAIEGDEIVGAGHLLQPRIGPISAPIAIVERGPVCESPADLSRVLRALRHALQRRMIARVAVMPYFAGAAKDVAERVLGEHRFRNVQRADGAHVRTLRLDLSDVKSDAIFSGGDRESLRRKLKQAEKAGVLVRRGNCADVWHLEQLHSQMMLAQGKSKKSPAYFEALGDLIDTCDRGALFIATHESETVAALFVMAHGPLVTFVIGASTTTSLPFSKMASAMAEAIVWAHSRGATAFDFGGIPADGDPDAKRATIAQFKFDFTKKAIDLTAEHARWF